VSIVLGVVGTVGAIASLFVFEAIGVMFLADLIFLPLFGWKLFRLSRGPHSIKT
jgi:mannitol-specific phosphotransferase system IIBC component